MVYIITLQTVTRKLKSCGLGKHLSQNVHFKDQCQKQSYGTQRHCIWLSFFFNTKLKHKVKCRTQHGSVSTTCDVCNSYEVIVDICLRRPDCQQQHRSWWPCQIQLTCQRVLAAASNVQLHTFAAGLDARYMQAINQHWMEQPGICLAFMLLTVINIPSYSLLSSSHCNLLIPRILQKSIFINRATSMISIFPENSLDINIRIQWGWKPYCLAQNGVWLGTATTTVTLFFATILLYGVLPIC